MVTQVPGDELENVTFEEVEHFRPARRWLYRLSTPIRFTNNDLKSYVEGELQTEYVVVSWGRDGDTCIFPADDEGRILDMLGFNGRMGWNEPVARLQEWIDGATYGIGSGLSFDEVAVR